MNAPFDVFEFGFLVLLGQGGWRIGKLRHRSSSQTDVVLVGALPRQRSVRDGNQRIARMKR
jgi:hypothetical protein